MTVSGVLSTRSIRSEFSAKTDPLSLVSVITDGTILVRFVGRPSVACQRS